MSNWMIYGANGYTGELIAREAKVRELSPILAGRSDSVRSLASELELEARVFSLDDAGAVRKGLDGVSAVLHCAGPFIDTSAPMVAGCVASGTHYLDITGEIAVFEACHRQSGEFERAGCVVIPGVGFDVVPTDCLAAQLAEGLPGAERLELAFAAGAGPSRGTAKTALRGLALGGAIREDGRIKKVPHAWKSQTIPFADKPRSAVTIPWGDVSTAFYSTGIGNIEVYMAMSPRAIRRLGWVKRFAPLLANERLQRFLAKRIDGRVKGPSADLRDSGASQVWGRVRVGDDVLTGTLTTMESYKLTVHSALAATERVVAGAVAPGAWTPSRAFGADFVSGLANTSISIG